MKMNDALGIINNKSGRYMVHFEWCGDGFLRSDYFPDKFAGEDLIDTEAEAWLLASEFARATVGRTCNVYVIDSDFRPVDNYEARLIANR